MGNYDYGMLEALQTIAKNLGRIADRLDSWDRFKVMEYADQQKREVVYEKTHSIRISNE